MNTPTNADSIGAELSKTIEEGLKEDYNILLLEWHELHLRQKQLKDDEMELRLKLVGHFFPTPDEGTNTVDLGNDWKVKDKHAINRKCDEASFEAVFEKLPEGSKDRLIKYKPELVLKEYRKLPLREQKIFDQALIIKPGTPTLTLVPPKEKK